MLVTLRLQKYQIEIIDFNYIIQVCKSWFHIHIMDQTIDNLWAIKMNCKGRANCLLKAWIIVIGRIIVKEKKKCVCIIFLNILFNKY